MTHRVLKSYRSNIKITMCNVYHVRKCMSYHEVIDALVITGRAQCLFLNYVIYMYILYIIYIIIYIYIYMYYILYIYYLYTIKLYVIHVMYYIYNLYVLWRLKEIQ